jgi:hypothetical protein
MKIVGKENKLRFKRCCKRHFHVFRKGMWVFTTIAPNDSYKTRNIEKKPTNLNTFEVIEFFVVSILKNPCVNERYRVNGR